MPIIDRPSTVNLSSVEMMYGLTHFAYRYISPLVLTGSFVIGLPSKSSFLYQPSKIHALLDGSENTTSSSLGDKYVAGFFLLFSPPLSS